MRANSWQLSPHKAVAHQQVPRKIAHQRQFRRDHKVGAQVLGAPGAADDQRGIARNVTRRGIDLEKCDPQVNRPLSGLQKALIQPVYQPFC